MGRPVLEVADVIRCHGSEYRDSRPNGLTLAETRVMGDIVRCRTASLGGHVLHCGDCGHREISYNSCRNRHCPKCQTVRREEWTAKREKDLLPVHYFHVVFTIPKEVTAVAFQNKRTVYSILFRASSETLREVAATPKHLGARIGILSVLHTWGQNLQHHPHVHCVVPGGGIAPDGSTWVSCRDGFFLPVRVLSRLFRGKFLALLRSAYEKDELELHGQLAALQAPSSFRSWISTLYRKEWVVYSKRPFGGPEHVLRYLAKYTHRTAISNHRLTSLRDGRVSFLWKDYANGCRRRVMTLSATEFLRRFLMHVLPKGFVRIRHYGFLANRCRNEKLARCRELLGVEASDIDTVQRAQQEEACSGTKLVCPQCTGTMRRVMEFEPGRLPAAFRPLAMARSP